MLLLLLLACGTGKDLDGDGVPDAADCAPDNDAVSPHAPEVCNGVDDDCDGVVDQGLPSTPWYRDTDGDGWGDEAGAVEGCAAPAGFVERSGDCDDTDPWTHPSAVEGCDGVDQDCDGVADDDPVDPQTWYADADGDGWGDTATARSACAPEVGEVARDGDCDDGDPRVSPDGAEVCGGGDEDCDGLTDLADPDVAADPLGAGAQTGFVDADGDGFGSTAGVFCPAAAEGWASVDGDCDDTDATSFPGAEPVCGDRADHDCDGRPDDFDSDGDGWAGCEDCDDADDAIHPGAIETCNDADDDCDGTVDHDAEGARTWYRDNDRDGYGYASVSIVSCSSIRGYVLDATDCNDAAHNVNPGEQEDCHTDADDDCDGLTDAPDALDCTDWFVDPDGDGWGDAGATVCQCEHPGAPYTTTDGGDCDEADASIHPAAADPCGDFVDADCDGDDNCAEADLAVLGWGHAGSAYAGYTLTTGVDVTGDGVADLVTGTAGHGVSTSAALVFAGAVGTTVLPRTAVLTGQPDDHSIGGIVEAADADGDEIGDVLVGDKSGEYGGIRDSGVVYLFVGPITGSADTRSATLTVYGQHRDALGWGASIRHDLDADGTTDLVAGGLIGSYGAYCGWPGTLTGAVTISDAAWCVEGDASTGLLGHALDTGDVDGDGVADLVYGMYSLSGGDGGVAWMAGPLSGSVSAAAHDGVYVLDLVGAHTFGTGHRIVDDLDGDGLPDLAASSGSTTWYFTDRPAGETPVSSSAAAVFPDTRNSDAATPVIGVDLDADGQRELVLGATDAGEGVLLVFARPVSGSLGPADALVGYEGNGLGSAVATLPDVDGDGRPDLAVGAMFRENAFLSAPGAILLLPGSAVP